ncbi:MAG: alpha/beta hydrolase, partial [Marmoricola sp.]|nr:alpha/beta hydrolase [Marmoricola sp.]
EGPHTVLAVHGITASAYEWPAVAAALPEGWRLVAPDLRGRGDSRDLPAPSGLVRHAADVCILAEKLAADGPLVLMGHSMGAYVAVLAAASRPELFQRLVLVDGGLPLPLPEGADPDEVLDVTLGPALERLQQVYPDQEAYVDFFRHHPALGPHWTGDVEQYVLHDVRETGTGVTSRCREMIVREDGRDLLVSAHEIDAALRALKLPTHLLAAPKGLLGEAPGLLPAESVQRYDEQVDVLTTEVVPDLNHYTIVFDPRGAARVAAAVTGELAD